MAYRTRWTLLLRGAALAAAAAAAAAGCTSGSAGTTSAGTAGADVSAVTAAQATRAFDSYVTTSEAAARADDESLALSDVTGVQRSQVTYDFKTYRRSGTPLPDARFSYGKPTLYLPAPGGYPRWFAAIVTRTGEPTVMVFTQASATAPWRLASASGLADQVPGVAANKDGRVPVQATTQATGLLAAPDSVGPLVAAVVDDGPSSAAARVVAYDPLVAGEYQVGRAGLGLTTPSGDIRQWELEGSSYTQFALRTKAGGALVFFTMYLNTTVEVPTALNQSEPVIPGPPITIPGDLKALLPAGTKTPRVELERQDLVSFVAVDPPAGQGKIQVIALGDAPNYASAS